MQRSFQTRDFFTHFPPTSMQLFISNIYVPRGISISSWLLRTWAAMATPHPFFFILFLPSSCAVCTISLSPDMVSPLVVAHLSVGCQRSKPWIHNRYAATNSLNASLFTSAQSTLLNIPPRFPPPFPVMSQVLEGSLLPPSVSVFPPKGKSLMSALPLREGTTLPV